jgi:hypothetical protein
MAICWLDLHVQLISSKTGSDLVCSVLIPPPRYLHPATREWKEGLMSVTFRDMANNKINKHQWIGG